MRVLFLLLVFIISRTPAIAQQFDSTLTHYNDKFVPEKAYVHFDKPLYGAGETLWFKTYLLPAKQTSLMSTSFYAELIDMQGRVIERKLFPLSGPAAYGDFTLPANLKDKQLLFRGYTTWMLNFDTAFLFSKAITIYQPDPEKTSIPAVKGETVLKFFPEGGDLISGLTSTLAFKATNPSGYPVSVSGVIKDNSGKLVDSFKTVHDGMGKFKFTPAANMSYYAEWRNEKSEVQKTELPAAKADGIIIEALLDSKGQHIIVTRRENASNRFRVVYLVAQMNNQVVFKAKANLTVFRTVKGSIQLDSLSTGILQLTAFDENWQPLAERITFINKNDRVFTTAVNVSLKDTAKRKKNVIEIEVPAELTSNLSVAVTDAQFTETPAFENNIISSLLLTSDLRGYIHNPGYYFSSTPDSVKEHLNLVMLTHGWRKYDWKAIAAGNLPVLKYERDNYLAILGSLADKHNAKIRPNTNINLVIQSPHVPKQVHNVPVSKEGSFQLPGLIFYDSTKVFYSFNKNSKINPNLKFNIKSDSPINFRQIQLGQLPVNISNSFAITPPRLPQNVFFDTDLKSKTLDTVVVTSKTKTKLEQMEAFYSRGYFQKADGAASFNTVDDPVARGATNVIEYIKMRYSIIKMEKGTLVWGASSINSILGGPTPIMLYLNEMPVQLQDLGMLPMTEVAFIKLFRPPFIFANQGGAGGAIAIYTKKGSELESSNKPNPNVKAATVVGYSSTKIFSSPDYATFTPPPGYRDVRSTLYWNPLVIIPASEKKYKFEFYNNDISKSFRVVIEGLNDKGQLTRVEKLIR